MSWNPGVDPTKLKFENLQEDYRVHSVDATRIALLEYIYGRNDFSKRDKMELLIEVMRNEPSMLVYAYAGHFLILDQDCG